MKKLLIIFTIVASFMGTSCRKERSCECKKTETTVTTGYGAGTVVHNSSTTITKEKQKKSEFRLATNCHSSKDSKTNTGGEGTFEYTDVITTEDNCVLK
jgi:hypothetical protein